MIIFIDFATRFVNTDLCDQAVYTCGGLLTSGKSTARQERVQHSVTSSGDNQRCRDRGDVWLRADTDLKCSTITANVGGGAKHRSEMDAFYFFCNTKLHKRGLIFFFLLMFG